MKHSVFDFTKIPFLKRLIGISRLIVKVLDNQNLSTESNLANWFSSNVQFRSGGHVSERVEAALYCGKINHLKDILSKLYRHASKWFSVYLPWINVVLQRSEVNW